MIDVLKRMMRAEGIIGALESTHAVAAALREANTMSADETVLVNLSGRGDKDIFTIADALEDENWKRFLKDKVGKL